MSFTLKQKARFYQTLYTGLKSGLDLQVLLTGGIMPAVFLPALARLNQDLGNGIPLSAALAAAKILSAWELRLLSIGEAAGRMDAVVADLRSYFEDRCTDFDLLKNRLIYPFMVMLIAAVVLPLPALAGGAESLAEYGLGLVLRLAVLLLVYKVCVQWPFERSGAGAFSPLLIWLLRWLKSDSWLRLVHEIGYLNLLTICQESGLDASATLRLLKDGCTGKAWRLRHSQAISQVENKGFTLSEVLSNNGILQHWMTKSFLLSSEQSGTLHSGLRTFVVTKKARISEDVRHVVKKLGLWFYVLLLVVGSNLIQAGGS